ncbi:UNVERIFIED_CONTAM: hypothetical protein FKN15_018220 [Acipenser sinensis]
MVFTPNWNAQLLFLSRFTDATPQRPPKHVPANPSFFALRIHSEATRPIVPEDNTNLNGSTGYLQAPYQPQGSLVRGELWITLPTYALPTRAALSQLCTNPKEPPVTVGNDIAWIRTCDLQAIGRILHSTWSAFTGCTTREHCVVHA